MAGQFEQLDRELLSLVSTLRIQTGSLDSLVSTLRTHASTLVVQASAQQTMLDISIFKMRMGRAQTLTIASTTAAMASGIAGAGAMFYSDTSAHVELASAPTATASSFLIAPGTVHRTSVRNGEKFAAMLQAGAAGGTLYVVTLKKP